LPQPATDAIRGWSPNPSWVQQHRPECVSAIGLVALAWTRVENELASMISGIVGAARLGYGGNLDWIVINVMSQVETIRVRLKVVGSLLRRLLQGSELLDEWESLDRRLYKRARDRNVIVHSEWAWSEDDPARILRIEKDGSKSLWSEEDFLDAFQRIKDVEHDLHNFMKKVWLEVEEGRVRL